MANFKDSFDLGLKAADDAAAKIEEINGVFSEMNAQLSEASEGKIQIIRETRRSPYDFINSLAIPKDPLSITTTTYIVAQNPRTNANNKHDIGTWEINSRGYPCQIKFGGDNFFCEDKKGLEKILALMLSDPDVGKVLRRLMSLPDAEEQPF